MFIQTEQTPNPATLKFLPGNVVMGEGVAEFTDPAEAERLSPLASRVFKVDGVTGVYLGGDFISVTKAPTRTGTCSSRRSWARSWSTICPAIRQHSTVPRLGEGGGTAPGRSHGPADQGADRDPGPARGGAGWW